MGRDRAGIARLNDPRKFKAWAFRIVTNKARDWLRTSGPSLPSDETLVDRRTDDDSRRRETASDLDTVLRRLPEPHRTILSLYYLEELTVAEVARALAIPKGTVKSRLHAARAEFRKLWQSADAP